MSSATDAPADRAKEKEEKADGEHHDADRPYDRDLDDEADDQQYETENDHENSCPAVATECCSRLRSGGACRKISGEGAGTRIDVTMGRGFWAAS
jgi:hypothetical protein